MDQTGNFANCVPEISKICYKLYREHQNCVPEIPVATYKLSRLADGAYFDCSKCFQILKNIYTTATCLNSTALGNYFISCHDKIFEYNLVVRLIILSWRENRLKIVSLMTKS